MSSEIMWYYPERILFIRLRGNLTEAEIEDGQAYVMNLLEGIRHEDPVHFIYEAQHLNNAPANILKLRDMAKSLTESTQLGWVISVHDSSIVRLVAATIGQLFGKHARHYARVEDAVSFLQKDDETLPELPMSLPSHTILMRFGRLE